MLCVLRGNQSSRAVGVREERTPRSILDRTKRQRRNTSRVRRERDAFNPACNQFVEVDSFRVRRLRPDLRFKVPNLQKAATRRFSRPDLNHTWREPSSFVSRVSVSRRLSRFVDSDDDELALNETRRILGLL